MKFSILIEKHENLEMRHCIPSVRRMSTGQCTCSWFSCNHLRFTIFKTLRFYSERGTLQQSTSEENIYATHNSDKQRFEIARTIVERAIWNHNHNCFATIMGKELVIKKICYKASDLDAPPYFKSDLSDEDWEKLWLDTTCRTKGTNTLVIYTILKCNKIVASSLSELVALGTSLTAINHGGRITREMSYFINDRAKDCVVRAKTIIGEALSWSLHFPIFALEGRFISVGIVY